MFFDCMILNSHQYIPCIEKEFFSHVDTRARNKSHFLRKSCSKGVSRYKVEVGRISGTFFRVGAKLEKDIL